MQIRAVQLVDAEGVLSLMHQLDSESKFMLLEAGERQLTLEQQRDIITSFAKSQSKAMFVLLDGETVKGFVVGIGNAANRNKHTMSCVIGLLKSASGQGYGKLLLHTLEQWAQQQDYTRIELSVMCHNDRAKALYSSCGFEVEGVKRQSLFVDGVYVDEFYMSKLLSK